MGSNSAANSAQQHQLDLSRQFLLAVPGRVGGEFANTIIYVCEHSEQGALGLVINRPTTLTVGDLLERLDLPLKLEISAQSQAPVFFGGPVNTDRGFVLHMPSGDYNSSINVGQDVALTTSRDILQDVAAGQGPSKMLVSLGYAGWGAGQLEAELADNAWINVAASTDIIFNTPAEARYEAALAQLGIDLAMLNSAAGHA